MNDTPRTDGVLSNQTLPLAMGSVPAEFARELERENRNLLEALKDLEDKCQRLLECEEVKKWWPINGIKPAEKPKDTYSAATAMVPFRRVLAINVSNAKARAAIAKAEGGAK